MFLPFRKEGDEMVPSKVVMGIGSMLGGLKLQVAGRMEVLSSESGPVLGQRQEPMNETDTGSTPHAYPPSFPPLSPAQW